jgi:hypothetical protein
LNFANLNKFFNPITQTYDINRIQKMKERTQKWVDMHAEVFLFICVDFVMIFYKDLFITLILEWREYIMMNWLILATCPCPYCFVYSYAA